MRQRELAMKAEPDAPAEPPTRWKERGELRSGLFQAAARLHRSLRGCADSSSSRSAIAYFADGPHKKSNRDHRPYHGHERGFGIELPHDGIDARQDDYRNPQ